VGAGAGLRLNRGDVFIRRSGRSPGAAEVGAGARLPVGSGDVLLRCYWRAP